MSKQRINIQKIFVSLNLRNLDFLIHTQGQKFQKKSEVLYLILVPKKNLLIPMIGESSANPALLGESIRKLSAYDKILSRLTSTSLSSLVCQTFKSAFSTLSMCSCCLAITCG